MRLFIASPADIPGFKEIQNSFKSCVVGKWSDPEHLHLTWIFLGNNASPESVIEKMQSISNIPITVNLESLGSFGKPPRILYAKVKDKSLYKIAGRLKNSGFNIYRFTPHVTLCRIKSIESYRRFKDAKESFHNMQLGTVETELILFQSLLGKDGAEYKELYRVPHR